MGLLDGVLGGSPGGAPGNSGGVNLQGMLGGLLGSLGGNQGGASNAMLATVMTLVQQNGGVEGIIAKFTSSGMSDHAASWVGTGANAQITGAQVQQALGASTVSGLASTLGVNESQAGSSLASMLPELINQLTPNGKVDAGSNDLLSQGLSMLKGLQSQ